MRSRPPRRIGTTLISSTITRISAVVLGCGGLAFLFAADAALAWLAPGFPPTAAWVGQLLGSAWLGMAALNWSHRRALLGGIYGRPVVYPNFILYAVSALSLLGGLPRERAPVAGWVVAVPIIGLAVAYAALLFRGPFDPLGGETRGSAAQDAG
jgi:hypothetical protein